MVKGCAALLLAGLLLPMGASGQDVIVDDVGDTITIPEIVPVPDTLEEPEVVVRNLPAIPRPVSPGWETGIWEWDREALQTTRTISLLELLAQVPGVTPVRGGDYGNPTTVLVAGMGPGRVRVFLDGAELAPLDGGVVDLARVSLAGLDRVRVERRPGELRIELLGLQVSDPRPYTLLEFGTGDLQTNLFRGTFVHPHALGGNLLLSLDRIDTDGTGRTEPGALYGAHVRHTLFRNEEGSGLAWEFRRMTSRRPGEFYVPEDVVRSDLSVRARHRLEMGAVLDAFYQRSSLGVNESRDGPDADTLITADARSQVGVRAALDRGFWWAEGEAKAQQGPGWPTSVQTVRGGGLLPGWGGVSGELERQGWADAAGTSLHARLWSAPVAGISVFGEVQSGSRATPRFVPAPRSDPIEEDGGEGDEVENGEDEGGSLPEIGPRFSEFTGVRVGVDLRRGDLRLGTAFLTVDPDSLHPTGLPWDRGGPSVATEGRMGWELYASLPLSRILDGLSLEADARFWNEGAWPYTPNTSWQARLRYHDVFFDSGNLEVWGDVGMQARDAMAVPILEGDQRLGVPDYQNGFARLQIRVVSVRIFVTWENFTFREENQDIPGRRFPQSRLMYGVRWTLWN